MWWILKPSPLYREKTTFIFFSIFQLFLDPSTNDKCTKFQISHLTIVSKIYETIIVSGLSFIHSLKRCIGECNVIFCVKGKRQSILENLSSNDINKWLNCSKKCRTALQLTIVQVSLEKFKKWGEIFIYSVIRSKKLSIISNITTDK